jgi:NTP pyrophosphatase (non-canonical NTP hydrolase)
MIYRDVLLVFGIDHQKLMMIEEMNELSKALLKSIRNHKTISDNMIEEIADVEIVLLQMKELVNISGFGQRFAEIKEYKITRLEQRIAEQTKKNEALKQNSEIALSNLQNAFMGVKL